MRQQADPNFKPAAKKDKAKGKGKGKETENKGVTGVRKQVVSLTMNSHSILIRVPRTRK